MSTNAQNIVQMPQYNMQPNQMYGDSNQMSQNVILMPNNQHKYLSPENNFQMQNNINYQQQMMINQRMAQGFQGMFFNPSDPRFASINIPTKKESSLHFYAIISTVLLIAGAIVFILSIVSIIQQIVVGIIVLVVSYILYISILEAISAILKNFNNISKYMRIWLLERDIFIFIYAAITIKLFIIMMGITLELKQGRLLRIQQSIDESGKLQGINDITRYKFYFTNQQSQQRFNRAYESFISKNKQDSHQDYSHTFEIYNFQDYVGFTEGGQGCHNSLLFYVFNIVGLALPYACIIERNISRYEINMVKRLICM